MDFNATGFTRGFIAVFTYEASEQGLSGFFLALRESAKIDYTAAAVKGRSARSYISAATIEKSPQWHHAGVWYLPANERLM